MAFCFALRNGVLGLRAALTGLQGGVADESGVVRRLHRLAFVLAAGQVLFTAVRHRLAAVCCVVAFVTMSWLRVAGVSALLHRLAGVL